MPSPRNPWNALTVLRDFYAGPMPMPLLMFVLTLGVGLLIGGGLRWLAGLPVTVTIMGLLGNLTGCALISIAAYAVKRRWPPNPADDAER